MNGSTIVFDFYSSSLLQTCFHCHHHVFPLYLKSSQNKFFFLTYINYIYLNIFLHTQHYNTLLNQNFYYFTERRSKRWDTTANSDTRSIDRLVRDIYHEQPQNYVENIGVSVLAVTFTGLAWMHSTFFNSNERNN